MKPGLVVDLFAGGAVCHHCGGGFEKRQKTQRFCSERCQSRARAIGPQTRLCKACRAPFVCVGRAHSNRWHCSNTCAAVSARRSRAEFKRTRADRIIAHRATAKAKAGKDTRLRRLWKKHPDLPRECEACAETRVLDIAHRPEHRRNGAWGSSANTSPEKIWVLCPRCHALVDRLGFTAEQLGIKERACVQAS